MDIFGLYACVMLRVEKRGCLSSSDSVSHQRSGLVSNDWILIPIARIPVPGNGVSLALMYSIDAATTIFCSQRVELRKCHIELTALLDACPTSYSNFVTYALVSQNETVPASSNRWQSSLSVTSAGRLLRFRYLPAWTHRQRIRVPSLVLVKATPSCFA
jgi:hypothetical protein